MNNLVAALLLVGAVHSSASGAAPPDSTLVIARVTPVLETGALAALDVEMQFTGDADGETALILPRPPAGEQPRFWETVTDVRAENAVVAPGDEPMDRVLTHAPGGAVTLRYRVRPRMTGTRFETIIQATWFSALGWGLFSELPGRPASIRFEWGPLPAGWTVASDLEHASLARSGAARDPWYELLNSALMGGSDVVVSERTLGAGTLRIAMRDDLSIEPAAFADVAGRIAMASTALWQDVGSDYFVAINVIPDYRLAQSGIGLGDGYALYIDQKPDPFRLYHTVAHEHMHSWIGRRFNHGGGWFREGFTDHYARLVNLHALRDGMVLLALIAGRPGNSREEIAFRVRDGDEERVIRYIPAGPGSVKLQEVTVKQKLTADAIAACTAKLLR